MLRRIGPLCRPARHVARSLSTSAASRTEAKEVSDDVKDIRPLKNEPIIKQMFLGFINTELFHYPEIETNEELNDIEMMANSVKQYMEEEVDSRQIDTDAKIPESTLKTLGEMGLFGQQVPIDYGGLGLNATKFARLAELTALDGAISVTLAAHQSIGLKGILLAGTPEQKEKYLPRLASGSELAAFCLTEPGSGSDAQSIQTRAELSEDGTHYLLNGGKIWISNGGIATIMTVFAKTPAIGPDGKRKDRVTAFIVERNFGGVTNGPPEDKLGIRGSNTCTVTFDNTPVPVENVLGEVGQGFKLAMNILNSGRFSMGAAGAGAVKRLLEGVVEYAQTREQFGRPIGQFQLIKEKIAKMATDVYAMESMTYLTAGLIDRYEKPDLSVEAAAVKVFSSEATWDAAHESLQIHGGMGYTKDYEYERYLRDARIMPIFEGTNEILRLFIGGTALQHAGICLLDDFRRVRNPLNNIGFIFHQMLLGAVTQVKGVNQLLEHNAHFTFAPILKVVGQKTRLLGIQVRTLLGQYGKQINEEQLLIKRCADISIDLYAIIACISRASRSISIGLRNADLERDLAIAFSKRALQRIDINIQALVKGPVHQTDLEYMRIAENLYEAGGYSAKHPLSRN